MADNQEKEQTMIVELKAKSKITISPQIVNQLQLKRGDRFLVSFEGGRIVFTPIASYPKEYVAKLEKEARSVSKDCRVFTDADSLVSSLEE